MKTLQVEVVSAEKELYSGDAQMVFAPAVQGEVGIAPGHTAFLSPLTAGYVRVQKQDEEEEVIYVSGGIMEVQPSLVTVLSDTAVRAEDLDEAVALEAVENAERALADQSADIDRARVRAELAQAVAQIRSIKKLRKQIK